MAVEPVVGGHDGPSPREAMPMQARRRAVEARRRAGARHEGHRGCWPRIEGQHCQGPGAVAASGVPRVAPLPTTPGLHQGVVMDSTILGRSDQ